MSWLYGGGVRWHVMEVGWDTVTVSEHVREELDPWRCSITHGVNLSDDIRWSDPFIT